MSIENKLIKLIEELQKAKEASKPKVKLPPPPPPEDHPDTLSEKDALKMVKEEVCKFDANGQWKLDKK